MSWNISAWSIRHPVPSLALFLVLMTLGVLSFQSLPVTRFPNIDVPIIQVRIYQSGAAPSELETKVTKEVEKKLAFGFVDPAGAWYELDGTVAGDKISGTFKSGAKKGTFTASRR